MNDNVRILCIETANKNTEKKENRLDYSLCYCCCCCGVILVGHGCVPAHEEIHKTKKIMLVSSIKVNCENDYKRNDTLITS